MFNENVELLNSLKAELYQGLGISKLPAPRHSIRSSSYYVATKRSDQSTECCRKYHQELKRRWQDTGRARHRGLGRFVVAGAVVLPGCHESEVAKIRSCRSPGNVASGLDAGVEVRVHEDGSVLRIPRSPKCAPADNLLSYGIVGCDNLGLIDVDSILVGKGRVCTFPGRNTAATASE